MEVAEAEVGIGGLVLRMRRKEIDTGNKESDNDGNGGAE